MYVSEDSFVHLRQAADERQLRELELRRIALERAAKPVSTTRRSLRELVVTLRRAPHAAPKQLSHT